MDSEDERIEWERLRRIKSHETTEQPGYGDHKSQQSTEADAATGI